MTLALIAPRTLLADSFYTLTPCRVLDTRTTSPLTGPRLVSVAGTCGVPAHASEVSVNLTAINPTSAVSIGLYPSTLAPNGASAIADAGAGMVRANNAVVALGLDGSGTLTAVPTFTGGGQTDFVLDVNGYFLPQSVEVITSDPGAPQWSAVSPTFYSSDPTSGTYYNPQPLRLNNTLYLLVQGGQLDGSVPPPAAPCAGGDKILLYQTPYTQAGLTSPFSIVSRISDCPTQAPGQTIHWSQGNIFFDGSGTYYLIGEVLTMMNGTQVSSEARIWTATLNPATNQLTGSWGGTPTSPNRLLTYAAAPGVSRITNFEMQVDTTRQPPADGFAHTLVRGFANLNFATAIEARMDLSPAYCGQSLSQQPCALIQFKQSGAWTTATNGVLTFTPDTLIAGFRPRSLVSQNMSALGAVQGPLELWGAYTETSNGCGPCPGPTGGGFEFFQVTPDWSLYQNQNFVLGSQFRCMPSGRTQMRSYDAPVYFGSELVLYSATNDANCATASAFFGMSVVATILE